MALSPCTTTVAADGRELLAHGAPEFPIACYYDDFRKENVPWHWHDDLEALIVTEGSSIVTVDTEKYFLRTGEGIFINAGVLHSADAAECKTPNACRFHSMAFHPRLIYGSMDSLFWKKYLQPMLTDASLKAVPFLLPRPPKIQNPCDTGGVFSVTSQSDTSGLQTSARMSAASPPAWHETALSCIETAWQTCVQEMPGYEFRVRDTLSQLIYLILSNHLAPEKPASPRALRNEQRIKAMLQYIHIHYSEELTTGQIAGAAMIGTSECLRCFHSTIGTSPMQYVKQYRVQKAAELLTSTTLKITEIGNRCGFQEMSYFAKAFREVKGCTPSQYREKHGV